MRTGIRGSLVVSWALSALGAALGLGCGARTGVVDCQDPTNGVCPTESNPGNPDAGVAETGAKDSGGADGASGTQVTPNNIATATTCTCTCTEGLSIDGGVNTGVTTFGPKDINVCLPLSMNYNFGAPNISVSAFTTLESQFCTGMVAENLQTISRGSEGLCELGETAPGKCSCSLATDRGPEKDEPACDKPCVGTECTFLKQGANCVGVLQADGTLDFSASQCDCNEATASGPQGGPSSCSGPTTVCRPKPGMMDPPSVTTGLPTEFLGAMSSVAVDPSPSNVKATAKFNDMLDVPHSDTETSTLSGSASLYGEPHTDGSADLILDLNISGTDVTFHFEGVDGDLFNNPNVPVTSITFTGGTGATTFHVNKSGEGFIPTNMLAIRSGAIVDGTQVIDDQVNGGTLLVTADFANKIFAIDPFNAVISGQMATISIAGTITNQPPQALIASASQTVECTSPTGASVVLDGRGSSDADGNLATAAWSTGFGFNSGNPVAHSLRATVTAPFAPPSTTTNYTLAVSDTDFQVGLAQTSITVRDTFTPVISQTGTTTAFTVCNPATQPIVLTVPTATDTCSKTVTVTGEVISTLTLSGFTTLSPPIPIVNGRVSLAPGTYLVKWSATDASGNTGALTQLLTIRLGIEANGDVLIDNGAMVRLPNGTPAAISNTGTGTFNVGVGAETGNVLTEGSVFLSTNANVQGSIHAGGSVVDQSSSVTVTGAITSGTEFDLPSNPTLGVTFPTSLVTTVDVEPGNNVAFPPGAYASIAVKSGAVLTLSTGVYFVGNLDLEPQATLSLNQAAGAVKLYVQSSIIDRGLIQSVSGTASGFVLGYAGTSLNIQSPFTAGTVIAPNADVVIASLGANAFTGKLVAQSLEVQPNAVLTCN
jgi:hypothetical protein